MYEEEEKVGKFVPYINKHTESIAKAIQVPHRPQQIQISNHSFGVLFQ